LIDWILIWAGSLNSADGSALADRDKNLKTVLIVFLVALGVYVVIEIVSIALSAGNTSQY
jgi:hypothetical protein